MRAIISLFLIVCLSLETPVSALADTISSPDMMSSSVREPVRHGLCFKGGPLPKCRAFMVTEFSYLTRLNTKPQGSVHQSGKWYLTGDLGVMVNVNERWALGGILFFGGDDDSGRGGVGPRLRFWFRGEGGRVSPMRLDITAGPLLWISDNYLVPSKPGFMTDVSLNFADWFALTGKLEVIRYDIYRYDEFPRTSYNRDSKTDVAYYIGAKGASYGAFIGLAVLVLLFALSAESTGPSF